MVVWVSNYQIHRGTGILLQTHKFVHVFSTKHTDCYGLSKIAKALAVKDEEQFAVWTPLSWCGSKLHPAILLTLWLDLPPGSADRQPLWLTACVE